MRDSCDTGASSRRSQFIHIALFWNAGWPGWAGFLVVVQNIVSSLFSSHLFDFQEGWIYVLGVGVAGGTALRDRSRLEWSSPRP
jgi:O-antigen ligase